MNNLPDVPPLPFPQRQGVRAMWSAIFLEPMINSGERICVAAFAYNEEDIFVASSPGLRRLWCMYGHEGGSFLIEVTKIIIDSINDAFSKGRFFREDGTIWWQCPIEGFEISPPRSGLAMSLEELANIGLEKCSSLVAIPPSNTEKLLLNVRELVVQENPKLDRAFSWPTRRFRAKPIADYQSQSLVASMASIPSAFEENDLQVAQNKLWNLAFVRTSIKRQLSPPDAWVHNTLDFTFFIHLEQKESSPTTGPLGRRIEAESDRLFRNPFMRQMFVDTFEEQAEVFELKTIIVTEEALIASEILKSEQFDRQPEFHDSPIR
jgi:hypothetical protein